MPGKSSIFRGSQAERTVFISREVHRPEDTELSALADATSPIAAPALGSRAPTKFRGCLRLWRKETVLPGIEGCEGTTVRSLRIRLPARSRTSRLPGSEPSIILF